MNAITLKLSGTPLLILYFKLWSLWLVTWCLVIICLAANWLIQRAPKLHGRFFPKMVVIRDSIARLKKAG